MFSIYFEYCLATKKETRIKKQLKHPSVPKIPNLEIQGNVYKRYQYVSNFFNDIEGEFLDIGCYKGDLRFHISDSLNYHGIDIYNNKFDNYVKFDFNVKKLPFKDESFDAICCCATMEHLFYPLEILLEMRRILTHDGVILISLPNDRGLNSIIESIFSNIKPYDMNIYGHHWRFSIESAKDFFQKAFTLKDEKPFYGPLFRKYLPFLKIKTLCTEIFLYGVK